MADSPPSRRPRLAAAAAEADLLSLLPLEVLDNILSRIHIRAVVRTSALSRAWRRRWESLPTVNLIHSAGIRPADIDALLLRRSAPVRTFRLSAGDASWYVDALHDWLLYLSRNGIRNLVLWFPPFNFRLHSSLFSCRELTSFNLTSCRLPPAPPGFAGFPSLKSLDLHKVAIPEHGGRQLASLISASPLLEKVQLLAVELIGDDPDDDWVIRGPNLLELIIVGDFPYGGRAEELPRLQEGFLFGCNYAKFLMGMEQVTKLEFYCVSTWSTEVDVLDQLPFLLKNLRSLVVAVNFTKMSEILSMFCLFRSAPSLEELDVWGWSQGKQEIDANDDFLNAQWVDSMFAKLRIVRMEKIVCLCNELQFVEFILSKARVLQVLYIRLGSDALCSNEEAVTYIAEYPRASPDAQVIFLGRESTNTNASTENAEVESTENAEVEESQTTDSGHDSTSTETDDAEVEEAQTTGSKEEAQAASSELGSTSTSSVNAEVEETQTTGNLHGSISMSPENAEVEDTQTTGTLQVSSNTSTENAVVEETLTTGSRLVYDVCPRRRQRLDLESVAQLEQLEEDMLESQKRMQLELEGRRWQFEENVQLHYSLIEHREFMRRSLQDLSTELNISLPPFPALLSHLVMPRLCDGAVNPGINGATSAHVDSPERQLRQKCCQ